MLLPTRVPNFKLRIRRGGARPVEFDILTQGEPFAYGRRLAVALLETLMRERLELATDPDSDVMKQAFASDMANLVRIGLLRFCESKGQGDSGIWECSFPGDSNHQRLMDATTELAEAISQKEQAAKRVASCKRQLERIVSGRE